ncbi:OLC1v1030786C1 [Oldenlandia corymbosa var. corymbosa]|uniref:OLC1v1030786C1 n=1 Tax=Oldenlandia corymbosa var. corymbosa TaxID=529605 RepID=A0AAV1CJT4_OLDCO|nr:OLC1v1030786C1 [Oldenlandia corymbosa var. corymbosa]
MARFSSAVSVTRFVTVVVCLAIWAPAACSGDVIQADGVNFLGLPWGLPCLQAVLGTEGCVQELVSSFLSLQPRFLGPECCKASVTVDDNCWPKIFPLNPFFPPLLKSFCLSELHP